MSPCLDALKYLNSHDEYSDTANPNSTDETQVTMSEFCVEKISFQLRWVDPE